MDPILLEETTFDVIIFGTGLIETYLSGALAVAGKKVLHLEEDVFYGSNFGTHPYNSFLEQIKGNSNKKESSITLPELPPNTSLIKLKQNSKILNNGSSTIFEPQTQNTEQVKQENEEEEGEENEKPPKSLESEFISNNRQYNLDITTALLWSRGTPIANMVDSGTSRYIEFHCMKRALYFDNDKFITAPVTKKEIFKSKDISFVEKRKIMSFVQNVMQELQESVAEPDKQENGEEIEEIVQSREEENTTFNEYMNAQGLTERLKNFILYIVCLCSTKTEANLISKKEGMLRVQKYQESSGVYGSTPFLYPLYGISEINQGYSRLGAVNGSIFILNRSIDSIVVDNDSGVILGIVCNAGQFLQTNSLVLSPRYFSNSNEIPLASRFVSITDSSLHNEDSLLQLVIPASDQFEKSIFISQLDYTCFASPKGKNVVHFTCDANSSNPKDDLEPFVNQILRVSDSSEPGKPNALFQSYFTILSHELNDPVPSGVYLCPEFSRASIGLARYLEKAEEIFHQICGDDAEFYPRRPEEIPSTTEEEPLEL